MAERERAREGGGESESDERGEGVCGAERGEGEKKKIRGDEREGVLARAGGAIPVRQNQWSSVVAVSPGRGKEKERKREEFCSLE